MRIEVLGKRWELLFIRRNARRKWIGRTEAPHETAKEILIEGNHPDELTLDTLIHEMFHAGNWSIDEMHVRKWSTDVARILTQLGYKRDPTVPLPYK
jgi:hypothetical protein